MDCLDLTYSDYVNYKALCATIQGVAWNIRKRCSNDTLTSGQKAIKLYEQGYKCAHCGLKFNKTGERYTNITCDHVIQYKYGGRANFHNIVLVHGQCNRRRDIVSQRHPLKFIKEHYGKINYVLIEEFDPPMPFKEFSRYVR